jgi:hypothetical protein
MEENAPQSQWIHHPKFGQLLQQTYQELGLECRLYYKSKPAPPGADVEFVLEHVERAAGGRPAAARDPVGRREVYKAAIWRIDPTLSYRTGSLRPTTSTRRIVTYRARQMGNLFAVALGAG